MMMKIILIILVFGVLLLCVAPVSADVDHQSEIEEGRDLVESGVGCDELSDEQLEAIGEYLMEQMHPGESHEAMHEMMGIEEGTEYHEQFHVNFARMMYCGEGGVIPMMGPWMMGYNPVDSGYGMMGPWMGPWMMGYDSGDSGYNYWNPWTMMWVIFLVGIIFAIIILIREFIIKKSVSETPIDILKKRYARGEITKKQFEEMKKEII